MRLVFVNESLDFLGCVEGEQNLIQSRISLGCVEEVDQFGHLQT